MSNLDITNSSPSNYQNPDGVNKEKKHFSDDLKGIRDLINSKLGEIAKLDEELNKTKKISL